MNKVDFGLIIRPTPYDLPANELVEYNWLSIQALPPIFTTLWVEDHFQWGENPALECLTTLSFLIAKFPNFRLGTLVLNQSHFNPALLAKMAANLQLLSGGRLILGLGVGWREDENRAYGYPFPLSKIRLDQLEEAILLIQSMWTSRPANFAGKYYQIQDAYCEPQPSPQIPLLVGGGGEQKTLRLVARYANWWNFNSCSFEVYAHKVSVLKDYCNIIGRDPAEIRLTYSANISVAEDPMQLVQHPQFPKKRFITGNATEVVRELERFCDIGVTHFMLKFPNLATQEHFVTAVVPHFA